MPSTLSSAQASAHPVIPDTPARMAKAQIRKTDMVDFRVAVGAAIRRAAAGLSLKELAAKVQRDERTVSRWLSGQERPHFDALFAVEELRQPLVIAFAELAGVGAGVEIDTIVRIRRIA